MKRILAMISAACLLVAVAAAAEPPVTQAEAAAVFVKADQVIRSVLQLKGSSPAFAAGTGVATRDQIVKHFAALYSEMQSKFKFTPPRIKAMPEILSFKDPDAKQTAERLETLGLIDRFGPLATSKSDGLSPAEFGDALGFFMTRIAELTHTPTAKFSPYLMPP